MISDPWFYLFSIPALLLTSISKGGFGLGLGVVAVPLMALRLPVPEVVALLLPILCLTDLVALWQYRGQWSWPLLRMALPAALVGIGLGTLAIHHLPEAWLRLGIGVISVDFAWRRWSESRRPTPEKDHRLRPASCLFWGATSGFTSFMANAGEPALAIYLLPFKLSNRCFAGTTAAFFAAVNVTKLMSFSMLGLFTRTTLLTSLVLTPLAVLGTYAGVLLNRRMNVTLFHELTHAILLVIGTRLIYTSLKVIL
ncbi:sulfite exporter TauE/SafE family protein [Paraburkholderia ultramafica]|uniref:sulfite exporter TauE/SafE family protein n=1 Tax=Paraburkholderia ultramafica TaxID=1544867 RepID=UPI0015824960|nr:sulfite exporter TauE/SafE family protein [Paraburkholderia ultramafica]